MIYLGILSASDVIAHTIPLAFIRANTPQNRVATLYISAGKKEKISKGDVAGFIAASTVTESTEIGKIIIHDHHAVVAIPANKASETAKALNSIKLKGKKVRVSIVRI